MIDLPDNEPEVVKLLVQYLYEAEYDPVLSGFAPSWDYGTTPPHTCDNIYVRRCDAGVCPHHQCGINCSSACKSFVCGECRTCTSPADFYGTANDMVTHAKVYETADKYDISGLKEFCIEKCKQACIVFWDDPGSPSPLTAYTQLHPLATRACVALSAKSFPCTCGNSRSRRSRIL